MCIIWLAQEYKCSQLVTGTPVLISIERMACFERGMYCTPSATISFGCGNERLLFEGGGGGALNEGGFC